MIKEYYYLAKPGIIYGNALSTIAGFFLASHGHISFSLLAQTLIGISLVMGAGCVFNNIWDQDIDGRMARTQNRALVTHSISAFNAFVYGMVLGITGLWVLYNYTNPLTALIAFTGLFVYVGLYTPLKRRTVYGTLIGAVSGAIPPVVGYCSVSNKLDAGAMVLFAILVLWQMPHFYAIAIYRFNDYKTASIPVLPVKKGILHTKVHMLVYIILFILALAMLNVLEYTSYLYLSITILTGLGWLRMSIRGFGQVDDAQWARSMFKFSLIVLLVSCVMIAVDTVLFLQLK